MNTTIKYTYDPIGNRISQTITHAGNKEITWHVRDIKGNILSVYTSGDPAVNGGALAQTELNLYGSSYLGILKRSVNVESMPPIRIAPFHYRRIVLSLREGTSSLN